MSTFTSESLQQYAEFFENRFESFSYDFTRCVRPDGSTYGSRGKCRKGTQTQTQTQVQGQGRNKVRLLSGQELANAMVQHGTIENRVRANNKGSLSTKKAKLELETELKKAGVPSKAQLREMALMQEKAIRKPPSKLRNLSKELKTLKEELKGVRTKKELSTLKARLKKLQEEVERNK